MELHWWLFLQLGLPGFVPLKFTVPFLPSKTHQSPYGRQAGGLPFWLCKFLKYYVKINFTVCKCILSHVIKLFWYSKASLSLNQVLRLGSAFSHPRTLNLREFQQQTLCLPNWTVTLRLHTCCLLLLGSCFILAKSRLLTGHHPEPIDVPRIEIAELKSSFLLPFSVSFFQGKRLRNLTCQ